MERCPTCGRKRTRSTEQNSRYWLLLHKIAEGVKVGSDIYSADTWHLYFKSRYLGSHDVTLPNGKVITVPNSTKPSDVEAFSDYMTKVEAWAAEREVYLDEL